VGEKLRPEEQLRRVRLKARSFFEQLDAEEAARRAEEFQAEGAENLPDPPQMNLFLRSLNSQLKSALAEVRESSKDLAELAAEVQRIEARLGQGN
jgi:hypothetical protein